MTVKEMLQRGTWMRSMHEPKTAAREIAAQEKVYRYHVLTATAQHGEAVVGAAQLTGLECQDMTFGLKRIMEEAIEMAAVLEGVGMETVVEMMATTYEQKQKDYNNSFGETQQLFGIVAGAVRLHDKVARMQQLLERGKAEVADERLTDTVRDLGTYAAMILCWMEENRAAESGCHGKEE